MRYVENKPAREFVVGGQQSIVMKDCAHIELDPDEQVTFLAPNGIEYDVARKSWGFYATPSLNSRLRRYKLSPVLIRNSRHQYFVLLVADGKQADFEKYLSDERLEVICRLDDDKSLATIASMFTEKAK